jgi:polyisoprenoid-binding protein YceI
VHRLTASTTPPQQFNKEKEFDRSARSSRRNTMESPVNRIAAWRLALLAAALLPSASGFAQQTDGAGGNQRTYQRGEIHPRASLVFIRVGKTGFGHEHGVVGRIKSGLVLLDSTDGAGELVFDMTTFLADTDAARAYVGLEGKTDQGTQRQVTANMLGSEVLDVRRHPTATFRIKSAVRLEGSSRRGLPQYRLDGEFTLHGTRRGLTVVADAEEKNGWLHLRGAFSILQSDYGMKPYTRAFGAVGVADRLDIWGDLWIAGQRLVVTERK